MLTFLKWVFVKGMRRAVEDPKIQELLRQSLKDYPIWDSPALSTYRPRLAAVLDLEGPDTTGGQHATLRGACPPHNNCVQSRALTAASMAIRVGKEGIECLADFCTAVKDLTKQGDCQAERSITLLEYILELGVPHKISKARILLQLTPDVLSNTPFSRRIPILVSSLSAVQASDKLQQLFVEEFVGCVHETLRDAQKKCQMDISKGSPNNRIASGIVNLARALTSASWFAQHLWPDYYEMLSQIPSEAEVVKRFYLISQTEGIERQAHMEFLIDKLCAGPPARTVVPSESSNPIQLEDPIWKIPMDVDRRNLRRILAAVEWADKATTTACVKRAQDEEDGFVQSLNSIIIESTDQVCVNLARFLGPLVSRSSGLDHCWRTLLLSMMRAKPKGLLDRLGESLSLQSWQEWLNCLQSIFGTIYLDAEGPLGFTKAKIKQWQLRKMNLSRADSDASTATRSTGRLSNGSIFTPNRPHLSGDGSLLDPGTPATIPLPPELEDNSGAHYVCSENQNIWSDMGPTGNIGAKASVSSSGVIPWYEREIESLNAYKPRIGPVGAAAGTNRAVIDEDEDIYN
ncbi:hypothetical protein ONZ43_g5999 [Nemania bipapillata]|uniref:Uncharacterized protein n=1 Tax=Nemania bipapillata TaxID=110536 RepID=A0ACC2I466_9PEZI|nr:hypothetical protein ONZ43_g5999 [Nemania bipapillata]